MHSARLLAHLEPCQCKAVKWLAERDYPYMFLDWRGVDGVRMAVGSGVVDVQQCQRGDQGRMQSSGIGA